MVLGADVEVADGQRGVDRLLDVALLEVARGVDGVAPGAGETVRLQLGKKVVATERVDTNAGEVTASIKPPKSLRNKERRYKLQIWTTDMAEIDSEIHAVWVYLGGS